MTENAKDVKAELPEEPEVAPGQQALFENTDVHRAWEHWRGMPEFVTNDRQKPHRSIVVHLRNADDVARFAVAMEQRLGPRTSSIWYPVHKVRSFQDKRYIAEDEEGDK